MAGETGSEKKAQDFAAYNAKRTKAKLERTAAQARNPKRKK